MMLVRAVTLRLSLAVLLIAAGYAIWVVVFPVKKPPRESVVIQSFYAHRATYEQLRDMLIQDDQMLSVGAKGITTTKSVVPIVPARGSELGNRYAEYLALLNQVGSGWAFRGKGKSPDKVGVEVWASGWGGDTRHISICWLSYEPSNQVSDLDDYYRTSRPRKPVFKKIADGWYLWADW
jgi:hypothetical protein